MVDLGKNPEKSPRHRWLPTLRQVVPFGPLPPIRHSVLGTSKHASEHEPGKPKHLRPHASHAARCCPFSGSNAYRRKEDGSREIRRSRSRLTGAPPQSNHTVNTMPPINDGEDDARYFETRSFSRNEDQTRLDLLQACPKYGPRTKDLQRLLRFGLISPEPQPTLASSLYVRELRSEIIWALLEAVEDIPDDDLNVVTIINRQWLYSPATLDKTSAATIKHQFRTHLGRAGILVQKGLLVGFLHGEFEPTSRTYQLHYHLVTTRKKAQAIRPELNGNWGYERTSTGAAPIVAQPVNDRREQVSYLFKAFWPQKPVIEINGKKKRRREVTRIDLPYHNQVLDWLNRQKLADVMITNKCCYRSSHFIPLK